MTHAKAGEASSQRSWCEAKKAGEGVQSGNNWVIGFAPGCFSTRWLLRGNSFRRGADDVNHAAKFGTFGMAWQRPSASADEGGKYREL